jgi:hypothetical protein
MLREEVYHKVAREFQTAIGTALPIITPSKSKREVLTDWVDSKEDKIDLEVNQIILKAIEDDKYQPLFRRIYQLEKKSKGRRILKSNIYKKAWKDINNA